MLARKWQSEIQGSIDVSLRRAVQCRVSGAAPWHRDGRSRTELGRLAGIATVSRLKLICNHKNEGRGELYCLYRLVFK